MELLSSKIFKDPILMKYLNIIFDGIYGNKVQEETAKVKELRLCAAIELLHKAHNARYCGLISLRASLIAYLTTHSKTHHSILEPILASGSYKTIRKLVNSNLSDFREIPDTSSCMNSLDNCQKILKEYSIQVNF